MYFNKKNSEVSEFTPYYSKKIEAELYKNEKGNISKTFLRKRNKSFKMIRYLHPLFRKLKTGSVKKKETLEAVSSIKKLKVKLTFHYSRNYIQIL